MSLHNGTAAETERKKMLEAQGHIILNLGQNQYGDLEDVCHDTIIEVKTSKNKRRDLSKKEKIQMENLLKLTRWRKIRYDIRFHGSSSQKPVWIEFCPDGIQSSLNKPTDNTMNKKEAPRVVSKSNENKKQGGT